jgi:hypothetical protein
MPESKLIDGDEDRQSGVRRQSERRRYDPIKTLSAVKADVVPYHDEIELGIRHPPDQQPRGFRRQPEDGVMDVEANPDHRS